MSAVFGPQMTFKDSAEYMLMELDTHEDTKDCRPKFRELALYLTIQ